MPSNFNTTPTSTTSLGVNQFPVSAVFVPGTSSGNTTALQGGPASTDSNNYTSAPMATYTPDGNDVAQGTTTDTVYSGSGAGTVIALLKKLVAELSATLTVSGAVTANAGTNLNTSALALESGGNLASANTHLANIDGDSATIVTNTSTLAGGVSGGKYQETLASVATGLSQANQVPVSPAGQQGMLTITGTLTANSDNSITFSGNATVARRIRIQNESAATIYWALDQAASAGSPSLAAPAANAVMVEWISMACTTLHIFIPSGGTTTLNGSGGVKVSAWA